MKKSVSAVDNKLSSINDQDNSFKGNLTQFKSDLKVQKLKIAIKDTKFKTLEATD